jgi:translation elongation factor EF-G
MDYMDEDEEEMEDYSDEQHEMAEELISAVKKETLKLYLMQFMEYTTAING